MTREGKKPDKIIRVGNREFRLYKYYDDMLGEELIDYPNFQEKPEYTDEGRPFVMAIQESCQYWKPYSSESSYPGDCSGCGWFYLEKDADAIGICMYEALKRTELSNPREER